MSSRKANKSHIYSSQLLLMVVILSTVPDVHSVIMPPRFHSSNSNPPLVVGAGGEIFKVDEQVPYLLSINEGDAIDMKIKSISFITVNLNRAAPEDVYVNVSIKSRPDLIIFDGEKSNVTRGNNSIILRYPRNSFGDKLVSFHSNNAAGHAEIVCRVNNNFTSNFTIDDSNSFISVNIGKSSLVELFIVIVGWIYFLAWSTSFYFQVILNYQRKSVVGLNFDFLLLNLLGFSCYTIFNYTLMFSREAQKDYYNRHEFSRIPVEYNDLFFGVHAVILSLITIIQCFIYERGQQSVSLLASAFVILAIVGGALCLIIHLVSVTTLALLDVLLYFSYIKLIITLVKYTPQAYMNYKRKATTGWSIHNILLDFTGGTFSIAQMFLISYNYDDWTSIFGNFTKFGLGMISITFDIVFLVQHYVLYKQLGELDVSIESIPSPVINQSVMSTSYRQPSDDGNNQDNNNQIENSNQPQ